MASMTPSAQPTLSECTEPTAVQADRRCKIVTFYREFADAIRAYQAFDAIAENYSRDLPVHATSWSFQLLGRPELSAAILRDSAFADVIVVAADGRVKLPDTVEKWIEVCMNGNRDAQPVVVALHDEGLNAHGREDPMCSSLERIAGRRGASFICSHDLALCVNHEPAAEPTRVRRADAGPEREAALYPATETLRWWGMND